LLGIGALAAYRQDVRNCRLFDDHVSAQRVHRRPIRRLGGIGIAAGSYASLFALLFAATRVKAIPYAHFTMAVVFPGAA
jgi:hypothetical protein